MKRLAALALALSALAAAPPGASAAPAVTWGVPEKIASQQPSAIDCPTESFCAVATYFGHVLTSANPADPNATWTDVTLPTTFSGPGAGAYPPSLSCPSASFCVAAMGPDIFKSQSPSGDVDDWQKSTHRTPAGGMNPNEYQDWGDVTCPTTSLCLAHSGTPWHQGLYLGPSGWSFVIRSAPAACTSTLLCVATGSGSWLVSTAPGDPASWKSFPITRTGQGASYTDCVADAGVLCMLTAGTTDGIIWSTNPAGGSDDWHRVPGIVGGLNGVECASTKLCLLWSTANKWVADTQTPTSMDPDAWTRTDNVAGPRDSTVQIRDISCPTEQRCFAVNSAGELIIGTGPRGNVPQPPEPGPSDPTGTGNLPGGGPDAGSPGGGGSSGLPQPQPFRSALALRGSYTVAGGNAVSFLLQVTGANAGGVLSGTTARGYAFTQPSGGGRTRGRAVAAKAKPRKKPIKVGRVKFRLQADVPKTVTLRLRKKARRLLARAGRLDVRITIKLTSDRGDVITQKRTVTLKRRGR